MPTTLLATALPHSLADGARFHLTVFLTHKLAGGALLSDFPAVVDWPATLGRCTLALTTSLAPDTPLPLRVVSGADSSAWTAVLPAATRVDGFPEPKLSEETWRTNPASRMDDHAVDLHLAAITAAPTRRPGLASDPVAADLLQTLAGLDPHGALGRLLGDARTRDRRAAQLAGQRGRDALATLGPLTEPADPDTEWRSGVAIEGQIPPLPIYQQEFTDHPSPIQILLDDPDADLRVTAQLDSLAGADLSGQPTTALIRDAHLMRRYYERPELPAPEPRAEPDPDAEPPARPDRPDQDFHARVGAFGATPVLLRRLGLAVDVVLDGLDAAAARASLAGATWVAVIVTCDEPDLDVLPPRRTAVVVDGPVFAARSSAAWVGGALPLGQDGWVVLDTDPDAGGLKLDQHTRTLGRQYATEANGDPATSAPGTLRATGFAIARRERADQLRQRLARAEALAADDGSRELLLDDLVRGVRVDVWDDRTRLWHSLHQRRVTITGEPGGTGILDDTADIGFLQLSALNRPPGAQTGYYLHEVVAGWDGWSLSAPRPGLTIIHVQPETPGGATEEVVESSPDQPIDGAHITTRVEPGSLPRLRYGTSYSFRVLAVDLAGNSVPQQEPPPDDGPVPLPEPAVADAEAHLQRLTSSYRRRDRSGVAAALRSTIIEHLQAGAGEAEAIPAELLTGEPQVDNTLRQLVQRAASGLALDRATTNAQRDIQGAAHATRILAEGHEDLRIRPQLRIDAQTLARLARNDDLQVPEADRLAGAELVTAPRPYLRWDPVPAPAIVLQAELGIGEQPAHLVIRSTGPGAPPGSPAQRHLAPPKATQLEAETAGLFDTAIGTGDVAEINRLYAIALAERGTLLDQHAPSLTDARATDDQPGIALVDRPGADPDPERRATLDSITADRGRPLGEGQYVIHATNALRLPYLPDPYAHGVSLVFYEAGAPHALVEPRVLQTVTIPYPGTWPALQPLHLVVEGGDSLGAHVDGHQVRVSLPPGEQVRVALASTVTRASLDIFGLWRSHLASVADPADGYTEDELVASLALERAATSGWCWWLTPAEDARLVHAVPEPVRPPQLRDLELFLRPPNRAVAALSGLVDVHGSSTDTLLVRATWTEQVDDPDQPAPQTVTRSDVVVRSPVGEQQRAGVLFLFDLQPSGPLASALAGLGLHRMLQTFPDTHYRQVTYLPSGTTRYAEFFDPADLPAEPTEGTGVTLDIPSSARPAAPVILEAVPLLRWESGVESDQPFAWRRVRRSGVRVWLARPWFSSGDGELLGVLVFDPDEWAVGRHGQPVRQRKSRQAPDGATSLWAADPVLVRGGATSNPTVPPLLDTASLLVETLETASAEGLQINPPLGGRPIGGRKRGWPDAPGYPVAVAAAVPLRDVEGKPAVRVLGYQPEYDESTRRWFVDVAVQQTPALWPFLRLAVARYQPHALTGCTLSPVAVTDWTQPLPTRTLTVNRPDADTIQVTLTGVVSWLRFDPESWPALPGDQLTADAPLGDEARGRASRLQQSRTVRVTLQHLPEGRGDLEWEALTYRTLVAASVEETDSFLATWTGAVPIPERPDRPAWRTPGDESSRWRVLIEEHELLNADGTTDSTVPRLVYADTVPI